MERRRMVCQRLIKHQINNFPSTWRATLKREMQYVFQLISIILWLWISIDIYSLVGETETQTNSDTNGNASLFLSSQALGQVLLFLCLPAWLIRAGQPISHLPKAWVRQTTCTPPPPLVPLSAHCDLSFVIRLQLQLILYKHEWAPWKLVRCIKHHCSPAGTELWLASMSALSSANNQAEAPLII